MYCFRGPLSLAAGTALSLILVVSASVHADPNVYALTSPGNAFGMFDLGSGTLTATGTLTGTADLARSPGGPLYGVDAVFNLLTIDPVTLTKTVIGFTGPDIDTLAIRDNGDLFGLSNLALFRLNSTTGSSTYVGLLGLPTAVGFTSAQFNSAGQLFLSREEEGFSTLYGVNTTTGHAAPIGSVGYKVTATHFTSGVLYGVTNDRLVISIDTATGVGTPLISLATSFRVLAFASAAQDLLHADFDGDLSVDADDLTIWKSNFGATVTATHGQGDSDGDHDVDGSDFLIWQQELGSGPIAASLPEPDCCSLLLTVGVSLGIASMHKRRR